VRYCSTMDVLVEMTAGTGWLARENERIVFLPDAESIDVAHDVIEPLLIPRDVDESFSTLRDWIHSGRPLPTMLLIGLESSVRLMSYDLVDGLTITEAETDQTHQLEIDTTSEIVTVGKITSLAANDDGEEASGMLVEGVIRAGGLRLHMHRGWGAAGPRDTAAHLPSSDLELELDGQTIVVGNGLVLGRWPYSHPDFNDALEPLILGDPAVSRLHSELWPTAGALTVFDKGSHNGTWVIRGETGKSLKVDSDTPQIVESGDQIRVGDTTLQVL